MWRSSIKDYRLALEVVIVVALLVGLRALLFSFGVEGIKPTALVSSITGGGVFVMGLVVAGTLTDYKETERAPAQLASSLYAILREAESMRHVWGKPDLTRLRERIVALRRNISNGNAREC